MKRYKTLIIILLLSGIIPSYSNTQEIDLKKLLPGNNKIKGWKKQGKTELFEGESLYEYINGGAEIFHEYGFKKVLVQEYSDRDENSIMIEIFEMNSDENSYGIYSFRRDKSGELFDIGNGAIISSSYLFFWKANIYIVIYSFTEGFKDPLFSFARFIAGKINDSGEIPKIMSYLPKTDILPASKKYIKGPIAFANQQFISRQDIFEINSSKEIALAEYVVNNINLKLFLINYTQIKNASGLIEKIKNASGNNVNYKVKEHGRQLTIKDKSNNFIEVNFLQKWIILAVSKDEKLNTEFIKNINLPEV